MNKSVFRNNIDRVKIGFKKLRCQGVDWIHLSCERFRWWPVVNT
jgi:hypothetical protein